MGESLLLKSLLVAFVTGLCEWDIWGFGQTMTQRPVVVGLLIGIVLGDIRTGLIVGGSVELLYLGVTYVGAAIPPDATSGAAIATALAIMSGMDAQAAATMAIPVATATGFLGMLLWSLYIGFMHKGDEAAARGDDKAMEKMTYLGSFGCFLIGAIPAFLAVYFGVDVVKSIITLVPEKVMIALTVAGGMLPALGFAMLFNMMFDKKLIPFFVIGFTAAAYLKMDLMAAALFGIAAAILYVQVLQISAKKDDLI